MSSYEKVIGGKLSFKGGLAPSSIIDKTRKKKKKIKSEVGNGEPLEDEKNVGQQVYQIDSGTGYAPDGKKSKKYEDLFPVEAKRFGYEIEKGISREEALDARAKKKADRYCK